MTQSAVRLHYKPMQWKSNVYFGGSRLGQRWIPLLPSALGRDALGSAPQPCCSPI